MEKISGILPSSARVQAVDLKNAAPVRPGTPTFGRPIGVSTLSERQAPIPTVFKAIDKHNELMDLRDPIKQKAKIVEDMADKFFKRNTTKADPPAAMDTMDKVNMVGIGALPEQIADPQGLDDRVEQVLESNDDLDAPEVGRYLDVQA